MAELIERIERLKDELAAMGPFLPGSVSTQWNVCGTPGCRCKDKRNPRKHGPYYQLSYTASGRSSTMFVKPEDVECVRERVGRYRRVKELVKELAQAYVELVRENGLYAEEVR